MVNFSALKDFDKVTAGFSGIWLIFLLHPISYLLAGDSFSTIQKIVGVASIALFSIIYLLSFGSYHLLTEPSLLKKTFYWNLLLLLPAAVLTLVLGPWIFYLSTFWVALWAFHEPQREGIGIGAVIAVLSTISLYFFFPDIFRNGGFGFVVGSGFVVIMAYLSYRANLSQAQEEELARAKQAEKTARDVHDILGHTLTVINLKAELASALATSQPEKAGDEMRQVAELSRTALGEVRATVTRLKRPDFAGELEAARRALETAQIRAHLPASPEIAGTNATLFGWVLREAITNVVRHSAAHNCWISVEAERLEILDDGTTTGFDLGNGLTGLQHRVREAGGDFALTFTPYTRLLVTMNGDRTPLTNPAESSSTHD